MVSGNKVILEVEFINTGGVPAYNAVVETWVEFLNMPFAGFTGDAVHQTGTKMTVHPQQPSAFAIPFGRALNPTEIADLKAVKKTLYCRIRLEYETLSGPHHTDHVFEVNPTSGHMLRGSD